MSGTSPKVAYVSVAAESPRINLQIQAMLSLALRCGLTHSDIGGVGALRNTSNPRSCRDIA